MLSKEKRPVSTLSLPWGEARRKLGSGGWYWI